VTDFTKMDGDAKAILIGVIVLIVASAAVGTMRVYGNVIATHDRNRAYIACVQNHLPSECKVARP
jgi:hypothetical protein